MKKIVLIYCIFVSVLFATPKDDFANILEYAKFSSCSELSKNILKPKFQISSFKLPTPFPWRAEITNGYKNGFFYYALLGYSAENSENIPYAYQCYRNATLYIDENKSFSNPEPTAELYLAIGRNCLNAKRYIDAKDWLETAYDYANNNPKIMAAIDRVSIQRANELNDFDNIILHYQHLEQLAGRQKTEDRRRKTEDGGQKTEDREPITDYRLRTTDYANYAQALFNTGKNRKGFMKLLEGISKFGIDNKFDFRIKDELVVKFLNNIARADDEDIEYFYDLLGYAIVEARAKAGDEHYLAFLCNTRKLLCKVFRNLNPEDDLKKVKKRIDVVKKQLADGYDVFGNETKSSRSLLTVHKRKIIKSQNRKISKSGEAEEMPDFDVENLLMVGDCRFAAKKYSEASKMYEKAFMFATGTFENTEYDGTTMKNAAIVGIIQSGIKLRTLPSTNQISNFEFQSDTIRSATLTLYLYKTKTNDAGRLEFDIEFALNALPKAHPKALKHLTWEALRLAHTSTNLLETANDFYEKYEKRIANIDFWNGCRHGSVLLALKKPKLAFSCFLKTLKYADEVFKRKTVLEVLDKTWAVATPENIEEYDSLKKSVSAADAILNSYDMMLLRKLVLANRWMEETGNNQLELSYAVAKNDKEKMAEILTNKFAKSTQFGHKKLLAEFLMSQNKTNAAKKVFSKVGTTKEEIIKKFFPRIKF